MRPRRWVSVGAVALVGAACRESTPPRVPTTVAVSLASVAFASINETRQLTAAVLDQDGDTLTAQTITWSTSAPQIVLVSATGLVTAKGNGTAQVRALAGSLQSAPVTVTVTQAATLLAKVAGDFQIDTVTQLLPTPLIVQVTDALGGGVAGVTVGFAPTAAHGSVSAPSVVTDASGQAAVTWTLGTVAGANRSVAVTATGTPGTSFTATALADAPTELQIQAGDGQTRPAGLPVPTAPAVRLRDQHDNGVAGKTVAFTIGVGSGLVSNGSATTNQLGVATVGSWTLGNAGANTLIATATGTGITGNPATFTATATAAGAPAAVAISSGDGQPGLVGFPVNVPPAVVVRDADGVPVSGVAVTFAVASGGGGASGTAATTDPQGIATVGAWTLGAAPGANTLTATVTGSGITGNPVVITADGRTPLYNIEVRFLTAATPAQQEAFDSAEVRWERTIFGDVADVPINQSTTCGTLVPGPINETVDDVVILVRLDSIDGAGSVLGQAGPCWIRDPGSLPLVGVMRFDTADVANLLNAGLFDEVILHEMAHVIGFGTIWGPAQTSLLVGGGGTDPHFVGAQAIAAFDRSGGAGYASGQKVPVENTGGGGTRDAHWRESVFNTELLTGFLDGGVPNPLSVVSAAAMADLGYLANFAASDFYEVANPAALRALQGERIWLRDDILRIPIGVVDRAGRLVRLIHPR